MSLDPDRLDDITNLVLTRIYAAAPDPVDSAIVALQILSSVVLALFLLFFLLKDGPKMWHWLLALVPGRQRPRVDAAGRAGVVDAHQVRGRFGDHRLRRAASIGLALTCSACR